MIASSSRDNTVERGSFGPVGRSAVERFQDRAFAIAEEIDDQSSSETLGRLELLVTQLGEYVQNISQSAPSPAERRGYLEIVQTIVAIITLVVAVMSLQAQWESSQQAEDQRTAFEETAAAAHETNDIMQQLGPKLGALIEMTESLPGEYTQVLRVARSMPLHIEQSMTSEVSGLALRGTLVDVVTRDRKWVLIRVYDQIAGRAFEGWIREKVSKQAIESDHWGTDVGHRTTIDL